MPRLCCGDGGWLCWGCAVAAGLGSPGWSRTRSCPSVSSQLAAAAKPSFHRLPKAAGVFCSPPCPLILTFIIHQAVPALPSVFGIAESGVRSCVGLSRGLSSSLHPADPHPKCSLAVGFGCPWLGAAWRAVG